MAGVHHCQAYIVAQRIFYEVLKISHLRSFKKLAGPLFLYYIERQIHAVNTYTQVFSLRRITDSYCWQSYISNEYLIRYWSKPDNIHCM